MKELKHLFDSCDHLMCYCSGCGQYYAIQNKYEMFNNLKRRTLQLSKYAIHDQKKRQENFVNNAIESTKEGMINLINDNDGKLVNKCPPCVIRDYEDMLNIMEEQKTDILKVDADRIFTKESCEKILFLIHDVYYNQLFGGYINVTDLRGTGEAQDVSLH